MSCITLANIDANVNCGESDNLAGVASEVIYGYWDDVATWPTLPAPSSSATTITLAQAGEWNGDVVMKTGKCAFKLNFTDETGELTMTDQGEVGGESVRYQLNITRAKISNVILGFENATRGRKMFFIVKDKNGTCYLMGDNINAARKIAADPTTTGKASTDLNAVPLSYIYDCPRKLIYAGDMEDLLVVNSGDDDEG